jgi:hypothetical protein
MRKRLAICDAYVAEYDIVFNAGKSKFQVVYAAKCRLFLEDSCDCNFYIGGSAIENVCRYSHVGHIITSSFSDIDDVTSTGAIVLLVKPIMFSVSLRN